MVYTRVWSDDELGALALAVSQHGCRWALISRQGLLPGRSPTAMRLKHLEVASSLVVAPEVAPSSCVACQPGCIMPWPAFSRSRFAGRPWNYHIRLIRPRRSTRSPTDNQAALIAQLGLTDSGEHVLLLCDLKRARECVRGRRGAIVSRTDRDALGLVHYPGDPCLTLTSDHCCYLWLGGSAVGPGRFIEDVGHAAVLLRPPSGRRTPRLWGHALPRPPYHSCCRLWSLTALRAPTMAPTCLGTTLRCTDAMGESDGTIATITPALCVSC